MKPKYGVVVALIFLSTCNQDAPQSPSVESSDQALGKVPASEVATWRKVGGTESPSARYLQAAAFDEARKVVVMFGGESMAFNTGVATTSREMWEWSPATGKWTNRTGTDLAPDARSGAAMAFDSKRNKFLLFGGRAGSGFNYEDTWEWDPTSGTWANLTDAGNHPSARSQHAMVFESSTGKVLLFGGGRSDSNSYDKTGISVSSSDTWEWDPASKTWSALQPTKAPSPRHSFGLVWDAGRNKAVLFAGMQKDSSGVDGVPKQDIWEWDPATSTWTEKTMQGGKPSPRYAHGMAFDGKRSRVVVFGGWDISTGGDKNDLWDWDPTTGVWTERLTGSESNLPNPRKYASLVSDDGRERLLLVAGEVDGNSYGTGGMGGSPGGAGGVSGGIPIPVGPAMGSKEVWELDGAKAAFTDRTSPPDTPGPRISHAMAYNPTTGKVYVYGGMDSMGQPLDDLWAWDGKTWKQIASDVRPPARADSALAYDPARKSLILFGGQQNAYYPYDQPMLGDTWEWSESRSWTPLKPTTSPPQTYGHGMVTDTTRNKILLFGGMSGYNYMWMSTSQIWEWDGSKTMWTNRTPAAAAAVPNGRMYPVIAYDEGRQRLLFFEGSSWNDTLSLSSSNSAFWEWDPLSAGWALRDPKDTLANGTGQGLYVAYDSVRRREVVVADLILNNEEATWELDASGPTWYVRSQVTTPTIRDNAALTFDSGRGVVVAFGGTLDGTYTDQTWEYSVTSLANGAGCSAKFASSCASGSCVDSVCCESGACSGPCQSCNVAGQQGTCVLARAGTEVAGSCSDGQACDGSGNCKSRNGQACSSASACASGNCVDGVCCDSSCNGPCASCNQAGRAGKCSPYAAGTDPQNECGKGTGVCKSTCDGVGACVFPRSGMSCGNCLVCNGMGSCGDYDQTCNYGGAGGYAGSYGGSGGNYYPPNYGGNGGNYYPPNYGGNGGGYYPPGTGGRGGSAWAAGTSNTSGTRLARSGCSCTVGHPASPGPLAPFLVLGAWLLKRARRQRKR